MDVGDDLNSRFHSLTLHAVALLFLEVGRGDEERSCVDAKRLYPSTDNHQVGRQSGNTTRRKGCRARAIGIYGIAPRGGSLDRYIGGFARRHVGICRGEIASSVEREHPNNGDGKRVSLQVLRGESRVAECVAAG